MKRILTSLIATAFAATTLFAQNELSHGNGNGDAANAASERPIVVHRLHGTPPKAGSGNAGTTGNGIDFHGGPVMVNGVNMYYIWYGNWAPYSNANGILTNFAGHIGGSPYFNINTTYFDGANVNVKNVVAYAGSYTSTYAAANPTNLTSNDIWNIVTNAFSHGLAQDPNGVYFVLTAPGVGQTNGANSSFLSQYCGWHTASTYSGNWIKYSFVGDANGVWGCTGYSGATPNGDIGADAMASVIAHELEEATTDPLITAWYDSSGAENADKCAWTFGTVFTEPNGSKANMTLGTMDYRIQQNWVNAAGGSCALSYSGIPDFGLSSSPTSQTVNPGSTATYNVTISQLNGFSSPVALSLVGTLPTGAVATFTPSSATTGSVLTITTLSTTLPGTSSLSISGTGGGITHTTGITLVVTKPDFSLSISPNSQNVVQGSPSGNYSVTVNPVNGFLGTVDLTVTSPNPLPTGVAVTTTPGTPGSPGTVKFTTSLSTPINSYLFTVTGTSGSLSHTVQGTLVVTSPGTFSVTLTPSTLSVKRSNSGTYTIQVTPSIAFSSDVALTVSGLPARTTATLSPGSVAGGSGSSMLKITAAKNAPFGSKTITVTGTGGGQTSSATATLTITN